MVVPRSVPPSGCIMMLSFGGKNLAGFCSLPAPRQCSWWCFTQELVVGIHRVRISRAKDFVAFPAVTLSARRPAPRGWCGHLRPMPIYYGQAAPGSLSLFFLALPDHVARVPVPAGRCWYLRWEGRSVRQDVVLRWWEPRSQSWACCETWLLLSLTRAS